MSRRRINTDRLLLEYSRARIPALWLLWLCLCAGLALWVIFKNQTFERPWQGYRTVEVGVADAKGVQEGRHQVRIAGVPVGVVKRTRLVDGKARLTLSLEEQYGEIHRDARIRIRPQTPLNDMYVVVETRGTTAAGVAGPRDVIPAEQTVSPVDVSRVLNTFQADTRVHLAHLLDGLGRGLGDDGGRQLREGFVALAPFLQEARRLSTVLARRKRATQQLVGHLSGVTGALAVRDRQLQSLVRDGGATLTELAARDRPLAQTLRLLPATLRSIDGSFTQVRRAQRELDPALTDLRPVARSLENGMAGLERFGRDAEPAFRALTPAVANLEPLVQRLSPTSRSLATAFARLRPQAPEFDRVTAKVEGCLYPLQKFLNWSLSVFKFGDGNAAYTRADSTIGVDSAGGLLAEPNAKHEKDCAE